ncbi:DUF1045 domain-containing protein [Magnetovibrio sp.]|uniref:DUF1045 domain-containing protein n=1 Tax=Magnetovibrio sp. TaxID=2024836 RepID=UPI002F959541
MSSTRYAIYFSPEPESDLWLFGSRWLGRDSATGDDIERLPVKSVSPQRLQEITADAAKYGFHATLKPPFHLSQGHDRKMLDEALEAFAASYEPVLLPSLELAELDDFIALRPTGPNEDLQVLAADCVRAFDHFRKPPSSAELEKRRKTVLTDRQREMLDAWGYPYVMDEFRFHMTLSGRLEAGERKAVMAELQTLGQEVIGKPVTIDVLTLFQQSGPQEPFVVVKCYPLNALSQHQWPPQKSQ